MKQQSRYRSVIVAIIVLLALVAITMAALHWRDVKHAVSQANWALVPLALLFTAVSYGCLSYGFAIVNRISGIRMGQRDLFEIGFVSMAMSHLVPAVGGYSVRLLLMQPQGIAVEDILATSLFHSYFNNMAMFSLLPIGLVHLLTSHPLTLVGYIGVSISIVIVIAGLALATVLLLDQSKRRVGLNILRRIRHFVTHRDIGSSINNFDSTLTRGVRMMRKKPRMAALLFTLIAGDWVATVTALGFCFYALGFAISPGVLLTGFAVGVTAGFVSMVPGGIGIQEGSMTGIYTLLGVPLEKAVLAALLFRVVYYLIPFVVSLAFYPGLLRKRGHAG